MKRPQSERLVTAVCVLGVMVLGVSVCACRPAAGPSEEAGEPVGCLGKRDDSEVITVFLTGNELGVLKPCGCFGGQLGGLERRSAILNKVAPDRRLIVDTGSLVKDDSPQELIKFDIMVEGLRLLGYDVVNLTERDMDTAEKLGLVRTIGSSFGAISPHDGTHGDIGPKFHREFSVRGGTLSVTVASFDAASGDVADVSGLFEGEPNSQTVNILIVNSCDPAVTEFILEPGVVDCLVCPSESDEAVVIGNADRKPLIVSVGEYGKYVGRLDISILPDDEADLRFRPIDVNDDLATAAALEELYKIYQQLVKDANLLEDHPKLTLPGGLMYVGSKACAECHDYAYDKWGTKAHAGAYATLEGENSHYDPECVRCHVVGMDYVSGFITPEKTPHLKDVGCENCHGPGSKHIENPLEEPTSEPRSDCLECHTPEHSGNFAGNEQLYLQKIVHW